MSFAATNWALKQAAGGQSGKLVLLVVADLADPEGCAFPSINYLAACCECSRNTVRRRLVELEKRNLLIRVKRYTPSGRRTSDEIRLALGDDAVDVNADRPVKEAVADETAEAEGSGGRVPNCHPQGVSDWDQEDPTVGRGPCQSWDPLTHQDTLSDPQTPSRRKGADDSDSDFQQKLDAFKEAFPVPTTRPGLLRDLFGELTADECAQATLAARGYRRHCDKHKRIPMDPVRFLREPDMWAEFNKYAPPPAPEKVFVERGSRTWRALCVMRAVMLGKDHYPPPPAPDGRQGALIDGRIDLAAAESLADFASESGQPNFDAWQPCEEGTPQWFAWAERIKRCGYRTLSPDLVSIPGERVEHRLPTGRVIEAPKRFTGRLVPSEWPPAMGTTPCANGERGSRDGAPDAPALEGAAAQIRRGPLAKRATE